ncbi:MAG: hypothetical protein WCI18_09305 [Pseudomonadota bacterium]
MASYLTAWLVVHGGKIMINLKFQERRFKTRKKLSGLMPGKIFSGDKELKVKPVDLGQDGLGVISEVQLTEGDRLTMETSKGKIDLKVIWIKKDFGKQDLFRIGLVTLNPKDNLAIIFESAGCLK